MNRIKVVEKLLPYVAGVLFFGMWMAAMDVSSQLSLMEDAGLGMYHDPVLVKVFWFESKACMVLPPNDDLSNCNYIHGIRTIILLSILLVAVLIVYMMVRKRRVANMPSSAVS